MIITDKFVLLNMPKTGSTFARSVLKEIHIKNNLPYSELILPNIKVPNRPDDQHGTFDQIPALDKQKSIVSIVRNPFEKVASSYRFGWWKEYPGIPKELIDIHFLTFPNITFEEYLYLTDLSANRKMMRPNYKGIGNQTLQFVQMYFRNSSDVLNFFGPEYVESGRYQSDLPNIRFLRTERLNEDLASFLIDFGYRSEDIDLCRNFPIINNSSANDDTLLWTTSLIEKVQYSERLLFRILSEMNYHYNSPEAIDGNIGTRDATYI